MVSVPINRPEPSRIYTGAVGNSFGCRPNYWDNMANYLITYVKSAACDAKVMNGQYWAASYEEMTKPEDKELYDMYTGYRSAWSGFLQSKHDKAVARRLHAGVSEPFCNAQYRQF